MELLQNKKALQILWKNLSSPIIWLSLDCEILDINKCALNIYKWNRKETIGKDYLQLCKNRQFSCPICINNSKVIFDKFTKNIETIITYRDKKIIVSWDILSSLDNNNKPNGFILIGKDITKLRQEESKNFQLDSIIAAMPNSVYWYDAECKYLGCNNNAAKILGVPRNQVIGKTFKDFGGIFNWSKRFIDDLYCEVKEIMSTGIATLDKEEIPFQTADGKIINQLSSKVPLFDKKGKVYAILSISVDITERKRMEEELTKAKEQADLANQAKSNFLAVMSHELRTPLNAILGIAQVVHKKDLNHAQAEQVDIILRAGDFLLALIDDILDFSKLEAGKLDIIYQKFDLYRLIQDIDISMRQLTENKDLQLVIKYSDKAPREIVADPRRVRQIITNFISNAVKFTDKGHVKLGITFNKRSNKIKVSVEDTGIGIPKSKMNQIFERFTQLDSKYSRRYGGAGLGLAICKQLVESMEGKIGVNSEYRKGSKFWFTLPLTLKPARGKKVKEDKFEIDDTTPVKPGHILLLEDNDLNQIVVKAMLEDLGCTLDIADNGKDALKLFEKQEYDLIFSDISLPDMSGIEVIQAMRKLKKNINSKKAIIAVTAHVLEEDRNNCLNAGADDVLTKPIMQPKLKAMLRRWIK